MRLETHLFILVDALKPADSTEVELGQLIELFYADGNELGQFTPITSTAMPQPARELLAHDRHMTVTVERYHGCPVDVDVLQSRVDGQRYSRKILLKRQSDGEIVMVGIVRMDLSVMSPEVQAEIQSQQTPLGRILINHHVMRMVKLHELFEIQPGPEMKRWLHPGSRVCYGRTALIFCDGRPAIELLEIVTNKQTSEVP